MRPVTPFLRVSSYAGVALSASLIVIAYLYIGRTFKLPGKHSDDAPEMYIAQRSTSEVY
jgi:hypothetical protein